MNAGLVQISYVLGNPDAAECWMPQDGAWRSAGTDWIVAHDLYHHLAGDTGRLNEEIASLGAEYYVCHESGGAAHGFELVTAPGLNALMRSAAGIIGIEFESGNGPESFEIGACEDFEVPAHAESVFIAAQNSALAELDGLMGDFPLDEVEWHAVRTALVSTNQLLRWMKKGYCDAKARFPNQILVQHEFETAVNTISQAHLEMGVGKVLTAALDGYVAKIQWESTSKLCLSNVGWNPDTSIQNALSEATL